MQSYPIALTIVSARNKPNVVPGSDCAGEVLAVGAYVKGFKRGDRVSANFNILHIFGDIDEKSLYSGLGGKIDGVLTEYRAFPAEVRMLLDFPTIYFLTS